MTGIQAPCLDCARRGLGCHKNCGCYAEYVRKNEELRARKREDAELLYWKNRSIEKTIRKTRHLRGGSA